MFKRSAKCVDIYGDGLIYLGGEQCCSALKGKRKMAKKNKQAKKLWDENEVVVLKHQPTGRGFIIPWDAALSEGGPSAFPIDAGGTGRQDALDLVLVDYTEEGDPRTIKRNTDIDGYVGFFVEAYEKIAPEMFEAMEKTVENACVSVRSQSFDSCECTDKKCSLALFIDDVVIFEVFHYGDEDYILSDAIQSGVFHKITQDPRMPPLRCPCCPIDTRPKTMLN